MRQLVERAEAIRGSEIVADVFEQNLNTSLARENTEFFERREGCVDGALGEFLVVDAEVLDQVAERHGLRDFEGALDFIDPTDAVKPSCAP